jgi:hypothetical protein
MPARYVDPGTDPSTATLTAWLNGREHVVADENRSGPIDLWAVEQAIELVKIQTEWTKK